MAVAAIPKGRGVWCPHASRAGAGCTIYADRPAPCREWSCAWVDGHPALLEADRPDKIGVVASRDGLNRITLHEGVSGALGAAGELTARLVAGGETVTSAPITGRPTVVGDQAGEVRRRLARAERRKL